MSIITLALLMNLLIETSESFSVVVPGDQIVAHVGSTVILPCWISPPENAEALEISWYRHDQLSNPVLFYQDGKIQDLQEESFRNRSSLTLRYDQSGGLKDGDVSLRLEKLTVQDEGSFYCYVSGNSAYGSQKMVLKVTAVGSAPVLFPQPLDDGRMNISCRSSGWYPEPNITWMSDERKVLRPGGTSGSPGADEMFSVHSWTAVSRSDAQLVSCSMALKTGEFREGRLNIQAIISSDSSDPWKALFFIILLLCALLGLVGLILYKYRHKLTGKKTAKEEGELPPQERKIRKDTNIEELRKHAVQITIDHEHSHPDLMISKDCKVLRDRAGYKYTGEGFPYELCASGAQTFTSGRHYWEVELAVPPNPPKDHWMIGVMKHGNYCSKDRSALTPSNGFWFLCSDGPKGLYMSPVTPITFPLLPRPERLGVLLDYDDSQLSFYNVKERKHLLTMSSRFTGSVIAPLFNPGVGDISPLTIIDCPEPVESPVESSQPLLTNPGAGDQSLIIDCPKPVESPVESSQPLLTNPEAGDQSLNKNMDCPEPVESPAESSQPLLTNPGVGDQSLYKNMDRPEPVESPVESSQPLLTNPGVGYQSLNKNMDRPEPVESPVESSQPLLTNPEAGDQSLNKNMDCPEPVESPGESSQPLLTNPGVGDQSLNKNMDCPEPVESPVESSQPLLTNRGVGDQSLNNNIDCPEPVESPVESSQPLLTNPGAGDQSLNNNIDCPEPVESPVESSQPLLTNPGAGDQSLIIDCPEPVESPVESSQPLLTNPGAGDQSLIIDCPEPVESPVESSQPLLTNPEAGDQSLNNNIDCPEPVESPVESSQPLLTNPGVGDQSLNKNMDCPEPVESRAESSQPLLGNS
ncbi:butyrophilin subfamily 1 member A1-like [Pseudorasbora parva]|uniref:butyrophilin subfamily 1 member A1-like n=1 Tax=Pseudorasbora parva TaxID=51549 RepID=UPI00351E2BA7